MNSIALDKKELRKTIKQAKEQISDTEKKRQSACIWEQLEKIPSFLSSNKIMLYWSIDDEVFTHDFILKWCTQKQIILPCVNNDVLDLRIFSSLNDMIVGEHFGIAEPNGKLFTQPELIDLVVVPGIAFDKQNNRMGRGKGYYDKFLTSTSAYKVGVCFNFQLLEQIPVENFDIKMNEIITCKSS